MIRRWIPFVLVALVVAACTPAAPTASITGVAVTPETASLLVGETEQLSASLTGIVGVINDTSVAWTSDDESVATVDADGLVAAVAEGTATVTATSNFDDTKFGTATITVSLVPVDPDVTAVDIAVPASTDLGVTASTTVDLDATVTAVGGASIALTWTTDNDAVATVDESGTVTSVAAGTVNITATSDFDDSVFDTIELTVHAVPVLAYADLNGDGGSVVNAPPTASTSTIGGLSFAWTDGVIVPDGITLDAATGALGGSSYRVAPFDVSVIVTDALGQSTTAAFQIDQVLVFEYRPDAFDFTGVGPVVNGDRVFVNDVVAFTGVGGAVASMPYDLAFAITSVNGTPYPDEDNRAVDAAWDENNAQGTISRVTPVTDLVGTTYVLEVTLTADSDVAVATVTLTYVAP